MITHLFSFILWSCVHATVEKLNLGSNYSFLLPQKHISITVMRGKKLLLAPNRSLLGTKAFHETYCCLIIQVKLNISGKVKVTFVHLEKQPVLSNE